MRGFCNVEITNTMSESIRHNGIIERLEKDKAIIRIVQQSACSGCHARGMCSASDSKEKLIEVATNTNDLQINDEVTICGQSSLGLQAVLFAFILPLIGIMITVVAGVSMGWGEGVSAIAGLLVLIFYYVILYFMRDKLKRKFVFTLEKQQNK